MKIYLKEKWSDQFGFDDDKKDLIFVGRQREISSLKHAILNNTSSTILISSVRGVGKTSFVHRALSEIRDSIEPIFVNVGHTLRDSKKPHEEVGRDFLTSLIRATFLTNTFKGKDIEDLYHQSIGVFKKEIEFSDSESGKNETTISAEINKTINANSIKNGMIVIGSILAGLGLASDSVWLKIFGFLGMISIPFSVVTKSEFKVGKLFERFTKNSDAYKIDNSSEYLETKFEQWLEKEAGQKKIVFVIDEIDKEDAKEAFNAIKEYKNLFARSFAHFIFICNQVAYNLIGESRLDSKYPTLFTHVFYLPTPTSDEMDVYLNEILVFEKSSNDADELKRFLLFKSANDFFSLKNLINDLSEFDSDGRQYLEIETVKSIDKNYSDSAMVYTYINTFYKYYSRRPKSFWQANSNLQAEIFTFANNNIMKDFTINLNTSKHITNLVLLLMRIGAIENKKLPEVEEAAIADDEEIQHYTWTHEYRNIESVDQLFPEDSDFIKAMSDLIGVSNDLDDLPIKYKDDSFKKYEDITKGRDGENLTKVNLFNIYIKYKDLYENLQNPEDRIYARAEEAKKATEEIRTAIKNATANIFNVFTNAFEKVIEEEKIEVLNTALDTKINPLFAIKSWETKFANRPNRVFYNSTTKKQVLLISGILNFGSDREIELAELRSNKDILVLNFTESKNALAKHPNIQKDAAGRKRKKKTMVTNFINYTLPVSIRDLTEPLRLAIKHFKK